VKFDRPRGTRDFGPEDTERRLAIESRLAAVLDASGYARIQLPSFEHTELFTAKSGAEITGHLYVFSDKGGRSLCLRPEATAQVARYYSSELRTRPKPVRVYYLGSMFRYERPQRGRFREFTQLGVELLGAAGAAADAEVIQLAHDSLEGAGFKFKLEVSHLGVLKSLLEDAGVEGDAQDKLLGLIDKGDISKLEKLKGGSKIKKLLDVSGSSKKIKDARKLAAGCEGALAALGELEEVLTILDAVDVSYSLDFGIARGLAYYTGTVFEARAEGLGAQDQIAGGGRYDNLVKLFGGPETPAVGFAFGFDRLEEAALEQKLDFGSRPKPVLIAAVTNENIADAARIAKKLRAEGLSATLEVSGRKLSKVLEAASAAGVERVVIVGARELAAGEAVVKDMTAGTQESVKLGALASKLS